MNDAEKKEIEEYVNAFMPWQTKEEKSETIRSMIPTERNKAFCNDCPDYEKGGAGCGDCVNT